MPLPRGPQDATSEIELDVVDAVLNLFANGFDKANGAVAGFGEFGGEGVPSSGGEKIAAGKNPRTDRLSRIKSTLHPNIDEVRYACRADAYHTSLQQPLPGVEPILHNLFGQGERGKARPFEMHVHIPETRQHIGALQVDDLISLDCR